MNWLEKIRQKPQKEKIKLVWIFAVLVSIFVLVCWFLFSGIVSKSGQGVIFLKNVPKQLEESRKNFEDLKPKK